MPPFATSSCLPILTPSPILVWPLAASAFIAFVIAGLLLVNPWFKEAIWLNEASPTVSFVKLTKLRKLTAAALAFCNLVLPLSSTFMLPDLSMTSMKSICAIQGCSSSQFAVQPSPSMLLLSSHCSLSCLIPSPQNSLRQFELHPSLSRLLLSSHCSPISRIPSPQKGLVQSFLHASLLLVLQSSHSSTPSSITPSPQTFVVQSLLHASLLFWLPSSHCSPLSTMPLPHSFILFKHICRSVTLFGELSGGQVLAVCIVTVLMPVKNVKFPRGSTRKDIAQGS